MSDLEQGTTAGESVPGADYAPTQDERTMATLAHVLQIVGSFIAPLIIFFLRRQSRFVSFHALQAVFLQLVYMILWGGFLVVWLAFIFGTMASSGKSEPPPLIFILFPLLLLFGMGMWVLVLVTAIVYGIKAGKGEWVAYPVIGRWARRVLAD